MLTLTGLLYIRIKYSSDDIVFYKKGLKVNDSLYFLYNYFIYYFQIKVQTYQIK